MRAKAKPTTIDEYLAGLTTDQRAALQQVRKQILAAVPGAEECISYQIPAFRFEGKAFVYMGAGAKHCALYGLRETEKGQLDGYDTSGRGTIRFQPDNPLPAALVRKLVKARVGTMRRR